MAVVVAAEAVNPAEGARRMRHPLGPARPRLFDAA